MSFLSRWASNLYCKYKELAKRAQKSSQENEHYGQNESDIPRLKFKNAKIPSL